VPVPAEGARAVSLAREAIHYGLTSPTPIRDIAAPFRSVELPPVFEEPRGVFVTLSEARSGGLRGCIGFPLPVYPMRRAIPRAAWAAAVDDPRFPPLELAELDRIVIEVSILTPPEELPVGPDLPERIVVGRDGLIVDREGFEGLLLPQVATEEHWTAERFLAETCRKAGLPAAAWKLPGTGVRRFAAELFRETRPGGPVEPHAIAGAPAHRLPGPGP